MHIIGINSWYVVVLDDHLLSSHSLASIVFVIDLRHIYSIFVPLKHSLSSEAFSSHAL